MIETGMKEINLTPSLLSREVSGLNSFDNYSLTAASFKRGREKIYVAKFHYPFFSEQLVELLNDIAPVKRFYVESIIADWNLITKPQIHQEGLEDKHAKTSELSKHWNDFRANFNGLFNSLKSSDPAKVEESITYLKELPPDKITPDYWREENLKRSLMMMDLEGEQADRSFVPDTLDEMYKLTEESGIVLNGESRWTMYNSYWKHNADYELLKRYFQLHPEYIDKSEKIVAGSSGIPFFAVELDGVKRTFDWDRIYTPLHLMKITHSHANMVKLKVGLWSEPVDYSAQVIDKDGDYHIEIDKEEAGLNAIYPVIAWRKKHFWGGRELIVDPSELSNLNLDQQDNLLLGAMTLAYLEPDLASEWPKAQGFSKDGPKQLMRAAQVPVLALQRRNDLAKSKLLGKIEQAVRSQS